MTIDNLFQPYRTTVKRNYMDDNFNYAKENILNKLEEAQEQTDELYIDELRWKIDKILNDSKDKVNKTFSNFCRKWQPPHTEGGFADYLR